MHNALFRTEPAKLAVGDEPAPEGCHVRGDVLDSSPDDVMGEKMHGGHAELGPAADGEGEAMTGQAVRVVGFEDDVGGRVVGIDVHRIRPIEISRGWKADVARDGPQDPCAHLGSELYAKAPMFVNRAKRSGPGHPLSMAITSDLLAESAVCPTIQCQ